MSVNQSLMRDRVGRKLGILSVGNSLCAEDAALINEKCLTIQKQLDVLSIAQIDFGDGIDEQISDIIVAMVASISVDDFMLGEPKRSQLAAEGALGLLIASPAERQLRKILAPTRVSRPVKAEYF